METQSQNTPADRYGVFLKIGEAGKTDSKIKMTEKKGRVSRMRCGMNNKKFEEMENSFAQKSKSIYIELHGGNPIINLLMKE